MTDYYDDREYEVEEDYEQDPDELFERYRDRLMDEGIIDLPTRSEAPSERTIRWYLNND